MTKGEGSSELDAADGIRTRVFEQGHVFRRQPGARTSGPTDFVDGLFPAQHYNCRMLAERPLPPDLERRLDELVRIWRDDPDLAAIYLFGSRAAGHAGPRSDVDLAVVLHEALDADARWRKRLELLTDACRRLGTDAVDVVVLEDAPTPLGHRVLKRGRLLSDTCPRRRAEVAERIMRQYLDEAYLRHVLDTGLAERLREGRFAR